MDCDFIITMLILLFSLISVCAATPTAISSKSQDLVIATEEMQKANYFTFVMLINMSPPDLRILRNITFLMPNDKTLSKANLHQHTILDFLLHHSIPSTLLFENMEHIPSGSLIPSSIPEYMFKICNGGGRRNFYLNNIKIISPNICTLGSSIRCHGIDGVLTITQDNNTSLPSTCSTNRPSPDVVATPPMQSSISEAPPLSDHIDQPPLPPAPSPEKSAACLCRGERSFNSFVTLVVLILSIMGMHV